MEPSVLNQRTVALYERLYALHYRFAESSVAPSVRSITRDLSYMGIGASQLSSMTVLNVGTGREAYVYRTLGVQRLVHVDLSELAISSLKTKARDEGWDHLLYSERLDICATPISSPGKADLAYLNGVFHHLYDPVRAAVHLSLALKDGGLLFLCIYRSGSLLFFLVTCLRMLVDPRDRDFFFDRRETLKGNDARGGETAYDDLLDDLFVPVLNLFDPEDLTIQLQHLGYAMIKSDQLSGSQRTSGEPPFTRFVFRKQHSPGEEEGKDLCLKSINQLAPLESDLADVTITAELFLRSLSKLRAAPIEKRGTFIVAAYSLRTAGTDAYKRFQGLLEAF